MEKKLHELAEDKIINSINQKSGGRLVIVKPENSQADLVVEERGNYFQKPIFLKIFVQDHLFEKNDFVKQIIVNTHIKGNNLYFVFVNFNIISQDIEDKIWFVPSQETENQDFSKFLIDKDEIGRILSTKFIKKR